MIDSPSCRQVRSVRDMLSIITPDCLDISSTASCMSLERMGTTLFRRICGCELSSWPLHMSAVVPNKRIVIVTRWMQTKEAFRPATNAIVMLSEVYFSRLLPPTRILLLLTKKEAYTQERYVEKNDPRCLYLPPRSAWYCVPIVF